MELWWGSQVKLIFVGLSSFGFCFAKGSDVLFVEMEPWLRISTGEDINAEQFFAASTYRLGGPPSP